MRYRVKGLEIRSENAAKPISQASGYLVAQIRRMGSVAAALDYGCGKLRYAPALARSSRRLTLVDSNVQLDRPQTLGGRMTSVRAYVARRWPHARVLSLEEFQRDSERHDFILCANVLSAIPSRSIRSKALHGLAAALSRRGRALFVTQYRNSDFKKMAESPTATPYLDGWILRTARGDFYYGILTKEKLVRLLTRHGLSIEEAFLNDGSAYVLAGPPIASTSR